MINFALWIVGAAMVALAIWRIRAPYARMAELDRLADNSRRYESWRGGRGRTDEGTTGADVMRQVLRRQVIVWAVVGIVGLAMVIAGFAIR